VRQNVAGLARVQPNRRSGRHQHPHPSPRRLNSGESSYCATTSGRVPFHECAGTIERLERRRAKFTTEGTPTGRNVVARGRAKPRSAALGSQATIPASPERDASHLRGGTQDQRRSRVGNQPGISIPGLCARPDTRPKALKGRRQSRITIRCCVRLRSYGALRGYVRRCGSRD